MPPSSGAAQLFVDQNYGGASATLTEGSYNIQYLAAPDSVGNDTVSSLLVAPAYTVTVYTDANFQGASTTFTTDTPYIGDAFNDKISSVKVTANSSGRVSDSGGIRSHRCCTSLTTTGHLTSSSRIFTPPALSNK